MSDAGRFNPDLKVLGCFLWFSHGLAGNPRRELRVLAFDVRRLTSDLQQASGEFNGRT